MCQRYAGRTITGQIQSTPIEAILEEAELPTVVSWALQLSIIAMKMALRMPDSNPRR